MDYRFEVLVGCYGDYPQYSIRCIDSIINRAGDRTKFDVHVGCSACGDRTLSQLRARYDGGAIDTLIESRANINKDAMMRLLIERAGAPYVLWLDDDSHFRGEWDVALSRFIEENDSFECAGHVFYCHRTGEYQHFLRQRPWWRGDEAYRDPDHRRRVWFATGGMFLARTEFLRRHNFPDRAMCKKQDDLLLGDLISQVGGRLIHFSDALMKLIHISDGDRRGAGESNTDGWLDVDPVTGY